MYDFLEGRVVERRPTRLVLEVGGVGYDLAVPLGASFGSGQRTRVWTHLVVREDAHRLYGFADTESRDLFRILLLVRGVGPSMALAILSGLPGRELLDAILAEDVARLTRIKGVGRKTAEQILLDLRDRAETILAQVASPGDAELVPHAPPPARRNVEDAVAALVSIGYPEKEARRAVDRVAHEVDPSDLELLVRTALGGGA